MYIRWHINSSLSLFLPILYTFLLIFSNFYGNFFKFCDFFGIFCENFGIFSEIFWKIFRVKFWQMDNFPKNISPYSIFLEYFIQNLLFCQLFAQVLFLIFYKILVPYNTFPVYIYPFPREIAIDFPSEERTKEICKCTYKLASTLTVVSCVLYKCLSSSPHTSYGWSPLTLYPLQFPL